MNVTIDLDLDSSVLAIENFFIIVFQIVKPNVWKRQSHTLVLTFCLLLFYLSVILITKISNQVIGVFFFSSLSTEYTKSSEKVMNTVPALLQ